MLTYRSRWDIYVISGLRRSLNKIYAPLGFYAMLTLEDGTDMSSRNVGNTLSFYAAYYPRRAQMSRYTLFRNTAEAVGFFGGKILSMPSFGGEVKPSVPCHRFAACKWCRHLPCKSHAVGKIGSAISCPYFLPSLIEVSHVAGRGAPLEMTGETKSGAQRARSYGLDALGLRGPGSTPTLLLLLLLLRSSELLYNPEEWRTQNFSPTST
jgi:hypothetical protein